MNLVMKSKRPLFALLLSAIVLAAHSEPPAANREHAAVFDHRYNHDRQYPPRGQIVNRLPPGYHVARSRGSSYYFQGGVWYRPHRSYWVVSTPPLGIVVPFLPPFYTTIWAGAVPYYYANDVYYAWRPEQRGYVIVKQPAAAATTDSPSTPDKLYIYPKNGQSEELQARDKYECHRWAANESGFDPTLPLGGVSQDQAGDKRAAYSRAMTACLEGRSYSVK